MPHTHDILIFGGGLAGSILADQIRRDGKRPLLITESRFSRCSRIAAGLVNPIGGKRLNLAWKADAFLPSCRDYFASLSKESGIQCFYTRKIARLFASDDETQRWKQKREDPAYAPYVGELEDLSLSRRFGWRNPDGIAIKEAGYVDTAAVLTFIHDRLDDEGCLVERPFFYEDIEPGSDSVHWAGYRAPHAVFAEGHLATENPWFPGIPYRPAKGVIGRITTTAPMQDTVLLKKYFVIPRHDATCYVGATYDWERRDDIPNEEAIEELSRFLKKELPYPWMWDTIDAGVRPATAGAKPVIGPSHRDPRLYSFNGFGSKGCLQIPFLARMLRDHLLHDADLLSETLPSRFANKEQADPKRWRATEIARDLVLESLQPGDTVIDATAGNGHDTLWLAEAVGPNGQAFAFDLQTEAIDSASQRIAAAGYADWVEFFHRSHSELNEALPHQQKGKIQAIVFNLGYLPGGDKKLVTQAETTIVALNAAVEWLAPGGVLSIVLYSAHPGGEAEAEAVRDWIGNLDRDQFAATIYEHPAGRQDAPVPIIVSRSQAETPLCSER